MAAREEYKRRVILPPRLVATRDRSNEDDFSQKSRLERLLSDGAIYGLIREVEAVVAAKQ